MVFDGLQVIQHMGRILVMYMHMMHDRVIECQSRVDQMTTTQTVLDLVLSSGILCDPRHDQGWSTTTSWSMVKLVLGELQDLNLDTIWTIGLLVDALRSKGYKNMNKGPEAKWEDPKSDERSSKSL